MNNNIKKEYKKQDAILEKCTDKKRKNPKFSNYIGPFVSSKMQDLIQDCGSFLVLLGDLNLENKKLHKGNFCKNRFCPMCSWRMSCKDSLEITILMEHLKREENKEFIFLTLTTPNVIGEDLDTSIKEYNKSFERLMKLKEVKAIVKGYIRKLEVTYQKEQYITKELFNCKKDYYKKRGLNIGDLEPNYNTYNPHFHVVVAVNKSYFTDKDYYITQDRWLQLWRKSTRNDCITQVDIRKAKTNDYKAVYEIAKYSAKDTDYLVNRSVFETFYKSLKGKQVLVFSGLFKDVHKMYINHELDCYKQQDNIQYVYMLYYTWYNTEYENSKIRHLTQEELKLLNYNYIENIKDEL